MRKVLDFLRAHLFDSIVMGVCVACLIVSIGVVGTREGSYSYRVFHDTNKLEMEAVKCEVVHEIDNYIATVAPNSSVNGIAIFEACEEYGVDVIFVLAQGQVESHYGTAGVAAKTNSIFNVLAYDGRTASDMNRRGHGYDHPDKSIRPYLKLLTEDYLVDGKTEMDMFKKFVNKDGKRYASATTYEDSMYTTYQKINEQTNIADLMLKYKKYKIITNIN